MTVQDLFGVLRERWVAILVTAAAVTLGALVVHVTRPAEYTAETPMYVSAQFGTDAQQAFEGAQLSEQRVTSYTELVTSSRVLDEASVILGAGTTKDSLAGRVTATSATDSVIIHVAAVDPSPQRAAAIANAVAEVTVRVVDELERPPGPGGIAPVAVRIVQPADVPDTASSAGLGMTVGLGLLAGLILGLGLALLRNSLDNSIKNAEQLAGASGAPNLGTIGFEATMPQRPLTAQATSHAPRAEEFRQLRTNLQFVDVDRPRKVITVTSATAGEGKSTTVANLAIALGSSGVKVLVIEADLRRPDLSHILGLDRSVGLTRVLAGKISLTQARQPWNSGAFDVLSSGPLPPNPSEILGSKQMNSLLEEARALYDIVLIDTPPVLPVTDAAAVAPATDGVLLVCRDRHTTVQQVVQAVAALSAVSVSVLGTVHTMARRTGDPGKSPYESYYEADIVAAPTPAPVRGGPGPGRPVNGSAGPRATMDSPTDRVVSRENVRRSM